MKLSELRREAEAVAEAMLAATAGAEREDEPMAGDNSRPHPIDPDLRVRFLEIRTWMQRMGWVDPVLNRFDTYTVPQATTREVAERLAEIASGLAPVESSPE